MIAGEAGCTWSDARAVPINTDAPHARNRENPAISTTAIMGGALLYAFGQRPIETGNDQM